MLDAQQRIAELEVIVAAKDAEIVVLKEQVATLMATVAALTKQVAELTEKLAQNSRNSHLPPSSDPPGSAGNPGRGGKPKSERRRGGQRGHRGTRRTLVPPEQVNEIVDLYPWTRNESAEMRARYQHHHAIVTLVAFIGRRSATRPRGVG